METEIFVLNPDYHFKNDYDRIAMYSIKNVQQDSSSNWISYIHPIQAAILNHFSKIKKYRTITLIWQKIITYH